MKKYFLTGLATLLPVAVTIIVVVWIVNFLTKPFMGIVTKYLAGEHLLFSTSEHVVRTFSQILILIALFLFILILGIFGRWLFFNKLIKFGDAILHRIPLVNKVYKTTKDIVQSLFNTNTKSFKQVVLLQFPSKSTYTLGLVTKDAPKTCDEKTKDPMVTIYIPTTPNPTTGYLIMRRKKDLIYLDMKSDEAVKYVVSCAMIQPGHLGEDE